MAMKYGGRCPGGYGRGMYGGQQMGPPLIPAPMAGMAMLVGLFIGMMIGRKQSTHMGMGMGGDWMMRKKMMGKMGMHHHHHGYGMPECECPESEGEGRTEGGA